MPELHPDAVPIASKALGEFLALVTPALGPDVHQLVELWAALQVYAPDTYEASRAPLGSVERAVLEMNVQKYLDEIDESVAALRRAGNGER